MNELFASLFGTLAGGLIAIGVAVWLLRRQARDRFNIEAESARQRRQEDHEERSRSTADELVQLLFELFDALPYATEYRAFDAMGNRRAATTNLGLGHERYADALKSIRSFDATKLHRISDERLRKRFHVLSALFIRIGSSAPTGPAGREILDVETYLLWVRHSARQYIGNHELPPDETRPDVDRDPGDPVPWEPTHPLPADA